MALLPQVSASITLKRSVIPKLMSPNHAQVAISYEACRLGAQMSTIAP